ncbi:MAG: hypothetical protein CMH52_04720 [Myxococcales bacterium]|nr:hypothetical protein [Myxococcales bacterium]
MRKIDLHLSVLLIVICAAVGCDDGSSSTGNNVVTADGGRRIADASLDQSVTANDAAPGGDAGTASDSSTIADSGLLPLRDCEEVCDFYVECDRLDLWMGRQRSACIAACEQVEDLEAFSGYRACLQTTACDGLQECRLPVRPRPTCSQVCETLDECGATDRLPAAIPGVEDCLSGCGTPSISADIRRCGEAVVADPETCNEPEFALCMLREQAATCTQVCQQKVDCGLVDDVIDCSIACLSRDVPMDPLALRRIRIEENCAEQSNSCDDFLSCQRIEIDGVSPDDVARLCAADEACSFFGEQCVERATDLLTLTDSSTLDCAIDRLENQCDVGLLSCLRPAFPPVGMCDEFCAVSAICGALPQGQLELECVADCRAIIEAEDRIRLAEIWRGLGCAYANSCDEFVDCTEQDLGVLDCAGLCQRRSECNPEQDGGCVDACAARQSTLRNWAERLCTQAAATCDGVSLCVADSAPPCDRLCTLYEACGQDSLSCQTACDDGHYLGDETFIEEYACATAEQACDGRLQCRGGDRDAGLSCLNWCQFQTQCGESDADILDCLDSCSAGLPGEQGLIFEASNQCLVNLGQGPACEDLSDCFNAVSADELCLQSCNEQVRCGLIDESAQCVQLCTERFEADDVDQLSCVLRTQRLNAGCGAVAECTGVDVEPASVDCSALCQAQATCNEGLDIFLCERDCTPATFDLAIRRRCADLAECDALELCLPDEITVPGACTDACASAEACDGLIGDAANALYATRVECEADCTARGLLSAGESVMNLPDCLAEAMCDPDAFSGCFAGRQPVDCGSGWDAVVACNNQLFLQLFGMINGRADYIAVCEEQFAVNPAQVEADLTCLTDIAMRANGDPNICLEQVQCLLGGLGP